MKQFLAVMLLAFTFSANAQSINIGERTYKYFDKKRGRPLITEIWYPTSDTLSPSDKKFSPFLRSYTVRDGKFPEKKLPLIMLSHGTGGGRLTLEWLAQALVKNGFIVAAVDHWGNTFDNKVPRQFFTPWERPQDISYVLSQILADNNLEHCIDENKIGATGFSIGGYTVLALAGAKADFTAAINYYKTAGKREVDFPELRGSQRLLDDTSIINAAKNIPDLKDNRIKAFFAICPAAGPAFKSRQQFAAVTAQVFILGAINDKMAPVATNARLFKHFMPKADYYEFNGKTGHYVMLNETIEELKKTDPIYFADDPSVNRHQVHALTDSMEVRFFKGRFNRKK